MEEIVDVLDDSGPLLYMGSVLSESCEYGGPQVSRQQFEMYTAQYLYYTATSALNVHGNFENPRQLYKSHGNFKNLTATLKISRQL
jgi:hypothetical protein